MSQGGWDGSGQALLSGVVLETFKGDMPLGELWD